jgi:hypothetical protein
MGFLRMAWTTTDLTAVESAIMAKVKGERVLASDLGNKPREYADVPLKQLMELRKEIASYLGVSTDVGTSRRSLTTIASDTW